MKANESPDQCAVPDAGVVRQTTHITQNVSFPYDPLMSKRRGAAAAAAAAACCLRADGRYFELQYPINGASRCSRPQRPH